MWKCPICEAQFNYDLSRRIGYSLRAKHLKQAHGVIVAEISVQKRNDDAFILKYWRTLREWDERRMKEKVD